MSGDGRPAEDDARFVSRLVDTLPGASFVIDAGGVIRFATAEAAALAQVDVDELVGRSVLEFVDEDTAWAYAASVAMASDYPDVIIGPLRVTIVGDRGARRSADLWANNRLDDPVIEGVVCLLTPETAAMGLGEAITSLASDAPLTLVARRVVRAMQGHPTVARAALLAPDGSGMRVVVAGDPDLPDMSGPGPWLDGFKTGSRQFVDGVDQLPGEAAVAAHRLGFRAVWVEPVGVGDAVDHPARGCLVLWRDNTGHPSPNELNTVHQGAAIIAMAWDRHDRAD